MEPNDQRLLNRKLHNLDGYRSLFYECVICIYRSSTIDRLQRGCKQSHAEGIVLPILALSARDGHSFVNRIIAEVEINW
jgi:hypothetical protein